MQRHKSYDQFDECALWAAVLHAGIEDHICGIDRRWIYSQDFDLIAQFLDLDADQLRGGIEALTFEQWDKRQNRLDRPRKRSFEGLKKWCYTFSPKRSAA